MKRGSQARTAIKTAHNIDGLPAGEFTLAAWHEKFGERELRLAIVQQKSKIVKFTFEDK